MSKLVYTEQSLKELQAALATVDPGQFPERHRELLDQIAWKKQVQKRKERWSMRRPYEYVTNLKPLDRVGWAVTFWLLFFPRPYALVFSTALALPVLGMLINGITKPSITTLLSLSADDKLDVADFIDMPAMAIAYRVFLDFEIDNYGAILLPGAVAFVLFAALITATHDIVIARNVPRRIAAYLLILFHVLLYSYGGVVGANCVYDRSSPQVYETTILGKHTSRGKNHTTYRFEVAPWGHHDDTERIKVPYRQYAAHEAGDTIAIDLHRGVFGIKWFRVE